MKYVDMWINQTQTGIYATSDYCMAQLFGRVSTIQLRSFINTTQIEVDYGIFGATMRSICLGSWMPPSANG